jgi:hypothetical protein
MGNVGAPELILLVLIGLFWVLPVVLSYRLGTRYGMARAACLALGILLGWIGFLIVWAMTSRRRSAAAGT